MHTNKKKRIRVGQRYQTSWNDQSPKLKDVQNVGRQAKASLAAGLQGELCQLQGSALRILLACVERTLFHPGTEQV